MRLTVRGAVVLGLLVALGVVASAYGLLTLCHVVIVWARL